MNINTRSWQSLLSITSWVLLLVSNAFHHQVLVVVASLTDDNETVSSSSIKKNNNSKSNNYSHRNLLNDVETLARYDALLADVSRLSNDGLNDGMLYPFAVDSDCDISTDGKTTTSPNCFAPPDSTIETTRIPQQVCHPQEANLDKEQNLICSVQEIDVDKHWGSDKRILAMRDNLRKLGSGMYQKENQNHPYDGNRRPPIFLMPGLASTRLVAWKHKACPYSPLQSDIKFHDYVWLNMKLLVQMGTIDATCWVECMTLGRNQTDSDKGEQGCKLRPDEGLDAIASLAPGGLGAELLVGQTNTLFAWLVQWLADNLGYDLSNMVGLPYDWRLSPHMMEKRDGFLSQTRAKIEAAVKSNGGLPGIMVAHSVCLESCMYLYICYDDDLVISQFHFSCHSIDGEFCLSILFVLVATTNA